MRKHGLRHGHGVARWRDEGGVERKYDGEWQDDKRHGKGFYTWADGLKYDGVWQDEMQHGKGVFTYANGDKYDGTWKADSRTGLGVCCYADGDCVTADV